MGTPDFAIPSLEALCSSEHEILAVFTQTDKPKGRGKKLAFSPVKEFALTHNITVYQPSSLKKETDIYTPIIKELKPDAIVVVAYGKLLPPEVLEIPSLGCINVHGSLLPKYRGAAPIQTTVLNGDEYGGVTTMLMGEEMDAGDILLMDKVRVMDNETSSEYYNRLSFVGADLLIRTLDELERGKLVPIAQDSSLATFAPMLSKEMSPIDFTQTAEAVHHKICGLSDWPCASCLLEGKKLKVYRSEIVSRESSHHAAGEIVNENDFTVACGTGLIRFTEVQSEGSKRMPASDYLRGHPIKKGAVIL